MKIKELIVVEGKSDIDFLSSFLDADFYQVHGSAVNNEDIDFLSKANDSRGIIILTDPDFPGMQIRNKIKDKIPTAKEAFVRKEVSIKHHKVGVAESTKEEVLTALNNVVSFSKKDENGMLKNIDLIELGLSGSENSVLLRKKVCDQLHIGFSNSKSLLLKLNSLNFTKEDLYKIIKGLEWYANKRRN